ncbi:NAD(P)H-hydrate dehydratase [Candidatus Bipolaricaulota bacterium]|nr:NAD(P)H-hydrate dehydratase [Candidatus Bipolaricaulota bacterium]
MTRSWPWIVQAAQQRALDSASIHSGVSPEALMESAGAHAAEWLLDRLGPRVATILVGPGGNGGDALVVARYLLQTGVSAHVLIRHGAESLSSLTQQMAERLSQTEGPGTIRALDSASLSEALNTSDCVLDGLFGSGLSRPLTDEDAEICEIVNASPATRVCLDVPSGIGSDSGEILGTAIRADFTLAMAFYKPCHWLYPAAAFCGDVQRIDVDYPSTVLAHMTPLAYVPERASVASMLPMRPPTGHKGTFGHVLAIAGSQGMTGAAILCALGALRAGAGRVTVALPETIASVIQTAVPEATTLLLPDCEGRWSGLWGLDCLAPALQQVDVIAIGPGLGRDVATLEMVRHVFRNYTGRLVIDADALYALVDHDDLLATVAGRSVLTPHPGELAALIGSAATDVNSRRLDQVAAFVAKHKIHLVLKGRPTVIGLPCGSMIVNPTGNTGLATGGSGDVLTGLMAGLIAGGSCLDDAAIVSPYIHGLVADQWAIGHAERSLMPSDILNDLPRVLKELES